MSTIKIDEEYGEELLKALTEAVMKVSRDPVTGVLAIRNAEVFPHASHLMASVSATSSFAATPKGIKTMSEDLAKRFRRILTEVRSHYDQTGMPGEVVHNTDIN